MIEDLVDDDFMSVVLSFFVDEIQDFMSVDLSFVIYYLEDEIVVGIKVNRKLFVNQDKFDIVDVNMDLFVIFIGKCKWIFIYYVDFV